MAERSVGWTFGTAAAGLVAAAIGGALTVTLVRTACPDGFCPDALGLTVPGAFGGGAGFVLAVAVAVVLAASGADAVVLAGLARGVLWLAMLIGAVPALVALTFAAPYAGQAVAAALTAGLPVLVAHLRPAWTWLPLGVCLATAGVLLPFGERLILLLPLIATCGCLWLIAAALLLRGRTARIAAC